MTEEQTIPRNNNRVSPQCGPGQAVAALPHAGVPDKLSAEQGIDANGIVARVRNAVA